MGDHEAKDPAPHAVLQHTQRFTTRYRDKLLAKTATIAAFPAQSAAVCGAPTMGLGGSCP